MRVTLLVLIRCIAEKAEKPPTPSLSQWLLCFSIFRFGGRRCAAIYSNLPLPSRVANKGEVKKKCGYGLSPFQSGKGEVRATKCIIPFTPNVRNAPLRREYQSYGRHTDKTEGAHLKNRKRINRRKLKACASSGMSN
jgi:hypothetical protein